MPQESPQAAFWNRIARRYAESPMRRPEAWEATLARVRAHLAPEARVLELGCGTGSTALRLAPHVAEYIGTDDATGMVGIARERLEAEPVPGLAFVAARPGDGSLPAGPFDAVLAFNLLHLLPDLPAALAEAGTLLKPGGLLITKTPCLSGPWRALWPVLATLRAFGKAPSFRFLSTTRLEAEIVAAGFTIEERGDYPPRPPSRFVVARKPGGETLF
ncbi:class I SAM-dependent methyltransferase [Roseicyclus sp.]|uniref:class I SAM-dependent methyltransferase n=1 Tax=Roseicyclus sp. TaxID=1914329 RepID=UPI003F9EF20B